MRTEMGRLRAPIAVATVLAFVVTACGGRSAPTSRPSSGPPSSAQLTVAARPPVPVRAFVPFGAGAPAIARTTAGSCWTVSITVSRPLAYRCFAGGQILDPCFARTRADRVVSCYVDPWTAGVRVQVARALPSDQPLLKATRPWALELAGGLRCVVATGVVGRVGPLVLLYRCGRAGAAGGPSAGAHPSVRFALGTHVRTVPVDVIWTA